jgi:hypothetical protein
MLRKIRRNFERWLTKPFRKTAKTIEGQPSTLPPQSLARSKGKSITQIVPEFHNGDSHGSLLIPTTLGIDQWGGLLPAQGAFTGHDVIGLIIGSPLQLLNLIDDFVTKQQPDINSMALLMGATCTPGDEIPLATREMAQAHWVRQAEARGMGSVYIDSPPSHRFISRKIGNIASTGGNGGDQKKALFNLQTDPLTVPDTVSFVNDATAPSWITIPWAALCLLLKAAVALTQSTALAFLP